MTKLRDEVLENYRQLRGVTHSSQLSVLPDCSNDTYVLCATIMFVGKGIVAAINGLFIDINKAINSK